MKLAVVGQASYTHIGGSLMRSAQSAGHQVTFFDAARSAIGPRWKRTVMWRLFDRRSPNMAAFQTEVLDGCRRDRPDVLIATGSGPLELRTLRALRQLGVKLINYSTDDPWNPNHAARWLLSALPAYDLIATPRRRNMDDFVALGCSHVAHVPFAYDPVHCCDPGGEPEAGVDILFVGGADQDRRAFFQTFCATGLQPTLVGAYWERWADMRAFAVGSRHPSALVSMTQRSKVVLCLVRHANRDGHVMRSFEAAAVGACLLVEDTLEHREMFGPDGECVRYFSTPEQAAVVCTALLADAQLRARLTHAVQQHIQTCGHTYADRLATMLSHPAMLCATADAQ